jgi:hypothetical protein
LRIMNLAWLRAKQQKMPVQRLVWFEKFCDDAMALIQEEQKRLAALQQPPQQSMQPPPGVPG